MTEQRADVYERITNQISAAIDQQDPDGRRQALIGRVKVIDPE